MKTRILQGILIPSTGILLYLGGNTWVQKIPVALTPDAQINQFLKFQTYGLALSLLILGLTLLLAPESKKFLRWGDLSRLSQPVKWLGIKSSDTWRQTGFSFLIVVTLATATFMYIGLGGKADWSQLHTVWPWVLLFSAVNAFNEEIITRFAVVGLLEGYLPAPRIALASAFIFGLPHYLGNPGGPIGMLMAGFLGWLLAKSILETRGMGTAWGIHFVQDVVIIGMLLIAL